MEEFFAAIIIILIGFGLVFFAKSCFQDDHRHRMETRAQCFEATKKPECFSELEK